MASGTSGADELPREKHKWSENSKVYARRIFRTSKNKNTSNNNSNSSIVTATPTSKDHLNGEKNGDGGVVIAVESNGGENHVANGVSTTSCVVHNQESDVAEVTNKENSVDDVPGNVNNVEEGPSNLNSVDELTANENDVDKLPANKDNVEKLPANEDNVEKSPAHVINNTEDELNNVEDVLDNGNNVEVVPDNGGNNEEMPNKDDNGEELAEQENNINEVPDKGDYVEELHGDHDVDEEQQKSPSPRLPGGEVHSLQPLQNSPRIETVTLSEDSLNLNRGEGRLPNGHHHDENMANGLAREERRLVTQIDDRLNISVTAAKSKEEVRDLKRKLEDELNQVRKMARILEAKESELNDDCRFQEVPVVGRLQFPANGGLENGVGGMRSNSESGFVGFNEPPRPFRSLSVTVTDNNHHGASEIVASKEKRTPKANQYYRNSDFILAKDKLPPAESNRKTKSSGGGRKRGGGEFDYGFGVDKKIFKKCNDLLQKLRTHKHGWVFNHPVDVKMLGLHDYFDIIKHPMDLGTVSTRLTNNWYKTPREFAEDVRLTFHNAMTYNPEGQDVHFMAKELLRIFEEKWPAIEADYDRKLRYEVMRDLGTPTPTSRKTYAPAHVPIRMPLPPPPLLQPAPTFQDTRNLERSQSMPVRPESRPKPTYSVGRTPAPKKPKAKDLHKRDMTFEEKQKLSTNLQSLPSEKLDAIVQIIKKRNSALSQHDDEIEVDIDSVDTETLWELDRFVTNYKKSLSKHKRKAELAMQARAAAAQAAPEPIPPAPVNIEAPRAQRADEGNVAASPHTRQQRHSDNASDSSSSSSSSSDSGSSSSDSDSNSSSDSGSDGDP